MNRLISAKRAQVIAALVGGNSTRPTVRMTGVAKNTVVKLLAEIGKAYEEYQSRTLHQTLRVTPAIEARVADHIWTIGEVVGLLQESVQNAA
jgi:hypothetical protein